MIIRKNKNTHTSTSVNQCPLVCSCGGGKRFHPSGAGRKDNSPCGLGMMGVPGPGGPAEPGGPCSKLTEPQEIGTDRTEEIEKHKDVKINSR